MTAALTRNEIGDLETLPIQINEYSGGASSPFSSGQIIQKYKPDDLKKIPSDEKTSRTDWFEKRLWGIWRFIGRPVPYAFRTYEGNPRSLDAGSLAYLLKREKPELKATLDSEGYISAVEPTGDFRQRYNEIEGRLIEDIQPAADKIANPDIRVDGQESTLAAELPQSDYAEFDSPPTPSVLEPVGSEESFGQGFQTSAVAREAVEQHAMRLASALLRQEGWITEDVSDRESYDFLCRRGDALAYAEVKGTTGDGRQIVMTHREVEFAIYHREHMLLIIVSGIELGCDENGGVSAQGGTAGIRRAWAPNRQQLKPISYICTL